LASLTTSKYAEAGHAFLNDHEGAGDKNPVLFRVMGKLTEEVSGYHEPSALDARQRIIRFFGEHLKE
jgi:carboxymethylenebutenolidase